MIHHGAQFQGYSFWIHQGTCSGSGYIREHGAGLGYRYRFKIHHRTLDSCRFRSRIHQGVLNRYRVRIYQGTLNRAGSGSEKTVQVQVQVQDTSRSTV